MASDERARHELYDALGQILPPESVETLMEHLPPTGWADVARRQDLDHAVAMLRSEMDQVGAELRGEVAALGAELRGEMAGLRSDLRGEISELRVEMHRGFTVQTRWFTGALIAMTGVLASLIVAFH